MKVLAAQLRGRRRSGWTDSRGHADRGGLPASAAEGGAPDERAELLEAALAGLMGGREGEDA